MDSAITKYPNLLAEHQAMWCLEALARHARVTSDVMYGVLFRGESLTSDEVIRLSHMMMVPVGYLQSHSVTCLDPMKARHKLWIQELAGIIYKVLRGQRSKYTAEHAAAAYALLKAWTDGEKIPYAWYTSLKFNFECDLRKITKEARREVPLCENKK